MQNSRFIGGLLLIIGTSIGGGMLALPVATAEIGFLQSVLFLFICWLVMTSGALLILEVNLRLPKGSNMVSMAKSTLGLPGQVLTWGACLLLMYTLLAGYISGGADILGSLFARVGFELSPSFVVVIFTFVFGALVYGGIKLVDYSNRILMFCKIAAYLFLVFVMTPHVQIEKLMATGPITAVTSSLMILVTSFGFASIVPTLREYFGDEVPLLRRAIILGSLIPLLCYIVWNFVVMGVIARDGSAGLLQLLTSPHPTSGLIASLSNAVKSPLIAASFGFFTTICMFTAFLGVSISLFDFISDGLSLKKRGLEGKSVWLLTFLPPLLVVILKPGIYLNALSYAGICCVVLLLLLPAIMAWKSFATLSSEQRPTLLGSRASIILIGAAALSFLVVALNSVLHFI